MPGSLIPERTIKTEARSQSTQPRTTHAPMYHCIKMVYCREDQVKNTADFEDYQCFHEIHVVRSVVISQFYPKIHFLVNMELSVPECIQ